MAHPSTGSFLALCSVCKVFKIDTSHTLSFQRFDVTCLVYNDVYIRWHVAFMWIPSHVGLAGNSGIAAEAALLVSVSNLTVPHSEYNSLIHTQALKQWQLLWNCETENKLHAIEPRVNVINLFCLPGRDEITIDRLRIGHTYLMHGHLLRGKLPIGLSSQVDI